MANNGKQGIKAVIRKTRDSCLVIRDPDVLRLATWRDMQAGEGCTAIRCIHEVDDPLAAMRGGTGSAHFLLSNSGQS